MDFHMIFGIFLIFVFCRIIFLAFDFIFQFLLGTFRRDN